MRLIGADGEQVGVISIDVALARAESAGLDLVEVASQATPPVCKIMDFGKYRYELQKKQRENKKKQHTIANKEVRMRPSISSHDLETKMNAAKKFLLDGSRVKVSIRFRGREMSRQDLGRDLMDRVIEILSEIAEVDKTPKVEGRIMSVHLAPK